MRRLVISLVLLLGTAVSVPAAERIKPVCDPNRVPSCWVEHGPSAGPQLVPVAPSEQRDLRPLPPPPTALVPPSFWRPWFWPRPGVSFWPR
jgi:hypothetical protein